MKQVQPVAYKYKESSPKTGEFVFAEQAEQEPEVWYCPDCGTLSETQVKCCPDWIRSRKVPKNFAINCKATFDRHGQAEQEPVVFYRCNGCGHAYESFAPSSCDCMEGQDFSRIEYYAAPVRTKDLTDEDLCKIGEAHALGMECEGYENNMLWYEVNPLPAFRAVIAADREKNRGTA